MRGPIFVPYLLVVLLAALSVQGNSPKTGLAVLKKEATAAAKPLIVLPKRALPVVSVHKKAQQKILQAVATPVVGAKKAKYLAKHAVYPKKATQQLVQGAKTHPLIRSKIVKQVLKKVHDMAKTAKRGGAPTVLKKLASPVVGKQAVKKLVRQLKKNPTKAKRTAKHLLNKVKKRNGGFKFGKSKVTKKYAMPHSLFHKAIHSPLLKG